MSVNLKISGIQADLIWHDPEANRSQLYNLIVQSPQADVYVLPETFSTGFSMDTLQLCEEMNGPTHQWMMELARQKEAVICGSVIIREGEKIFNRFLWINPKGQTEVYDKRHRFTMAGEHKHFSAGNKQLIVELKGWRILLLVCYDLRFPVWSRNRNNYDAVFYIANWPAARVTAWSKLLQARAIENQCYVVGVNRVGTDGNGIVYSGDSAIVDPKGEVISKLDFGEEGHVSAELDMTELLSFREKFPVLEDGDDFELKVN